VLSSPGRASADGLKQALFGAIGLFFLYHLHRFLLSLEGGRPFDGTNERRLRLMAGGVLSVGALRDVSQFAGLGPRLHDVGALVRTLVPGAYVGHEVSVSWEWYLTAAVIFAVAHAFADGTRLQRDHDLTV
jgi:hypothetical protein